MSRTVRRRFAYTARVRTKVGGAGHAAWSARVRFERREWGSSVREVQRTKSIVESFDELIDPSHPDMPPGFDLETPEIRSYIERARAARAVADAVAEQLAPIQAQWKAQTASTSDYPLDGWTPAASPPATTDPTA
ncbi:hypothetical protein M3C36_06475 [Dietzia cinnamea]|uniref:hypothetical protein n=1 Tax=Dietzia TaxID=37914 RepID=UPI000D087421|nr:MULTISPECIES: hypothetical protein [Dietzia]AVM66145.1 hypothetical protein C3V38_16445 [Dietzia sp. oral taxon 368]MCT1884831.1 hypothetical protein [Dietzia cinnamea]